MKKGILIIGGLLLLWAVLKGKVAQAAPEDLSTVGAGPILGESPPAEHGLGYTSPGLQTQTVQLVRGWNDVTLTVTPWNSGNWKAIFPNAQVVYWWNADQKKYQEVGADHDNAGPITPALLEAGKTFKVANLVDETIEIRAGPGHILAPVEEPGGWPIVTTPAPHEIETMPPIVYR